MTTTQLGANKTPFSISDILTDLKVHGHNQSPRGGGGEECNKSEESDSVMRFNHHQDSGHRVNVKQMIYGINGSSSAGSEGLAYSDMASAMRRRVEEKRGSGSFVRRGSLECFLIDNNKAQNQNYAGVNRPDSLYFSDQGAGQKPLDMRRSVGSISDHYDSGEQIIFNNTFNNRADNIIIVH